VWILRLLHGICCSLIASRGQRVPCLPGLADATFRLSVRRLVKNRFPMELWAKGGGWQVVGDPLAHSSPPSAVGPENSKEPISLGQEVGDRPGLRAEGAGERERGSGAALSFRQRLKGQEPARMATRRHVV
jgi:hypothetical protein